MIKRTYLKAVCVDSDVDVNTTVINLGGKPTINVNSNKPKWQAHS